MLIGGTLHNVGDTVTFPIGNTSVLYVTTDANGAKANDTTTVQVLPLATYVYSYSVSALFLYPCVPPERPMRAQCWQ